MAGAVAIHKAQRLSLDRAVVDIGPKEMRVGLTYVAVSRVGSLNRLVISK